MNAATNQMTSVSYDAAGDQENDAISNTFTYDAEGNVTEVNGGNTGKYVYDAMNHRVQTITSAGTYEYLYDALGRRTSTWQTSPNFGMEGRVYWGSTGKQIAYRAFNGQTFYEHQNYLGTERMRTNYAGQVAATEFSLAYGDDLNQTTDLTDGNQDNNQYAGQEYDSESGSQHAQFRQYSSTQGRWMSPDPYDGSYSIYNPQSLNRYNYALNNPLIYVDPLGLELTCVDSYLYDSDGNVISISSACVDTVSGGGGGSSNISISGYGNGPNLYIPLMPVPQLQIAPNKPTQPTTKQKFQKWALNQLCSTSPEQEVMSSAVDGAVSGTVTGALEGGIFGTIFSVPIGGIGGIPAAGLGGFVGGVFGATSGVIQGAEMAGVCSLFNVY